MQSCECGSPLLFALRYLPHGPIALTIDRKLTVNEGPRPHLFLYSSQKRTPRKHSVALVVVSAIPELLLCQRKARCSSYQPGRRDVSGYRVPALLGDSTQSKSSPNDKIHAVQKVRVQLDVSVSYGHPDTVMRCTRVR